MKNNSIIRTIKDKKHPTEKFLDFWDRMDKFFGRELRRDEVEMWADLVGIPLPTVVVKQKFYNRRMTK